MANAKNKYDSLSCSYNFGREAGEATKPFYPDIICPMMKVNRKPLDHPTMTIEQCLIRRQVGNKCTKNCKVLDEYLRKK